MNAPASSARPTNSSTRSRRSSKSVPSSPSSPAEPPPQQISFCKSIYLKGVLLDALLFAGAALQSPRTSLVSQRYHGIDSHGPPCRDVTREGRHQYQEEHHDRESFRICRSHLKEEPFHQSRQKQSSHGTQHNSKQRQPYAVAHNQ